MTSPSRRARKPVLSITINVRLEGTPAELSSLHKKLAGSKLSKGVLSRSVSATDPSVAMEDLKSLGDAIKSERL